MGTKNGGGQKTPVHGLTRQGSLYGLTLNEVENHLGEPLHSMNLDELLKSVFPAEANQNLSIDLGGASSRYDVSSGLQRQESITMPRTLSKKTVEDVWKDIQQSQGKNVDKEGNCTHERQLTLGEMTLEDFLMKAGVVAEGIAKDANDVIVNATMPIEGMADFAQSSQWLKYQHMNMEQQIQGQNYMMGGYVKGVKGCLVPKPMNVGAGPICDSVLPGLSPSLGTLLDSQKPGKKRGAIGDVDDKVVERRQKRMIKNRESASRSRARKQAYTNELEEKVLRLEKELASLRELKEQEKIMYIAPEPEPNHRLKRTNSAFF